MRNLILLALAAAAVWIHLNGWPSRQAAPAKSSASTSAGPENGLLPASTPAEPSASAAFLKTETDGVPEPDFVKKAKADMARLAAETPANPTAAPPRKVAPIIIDGSAFGFPKEPKLAKDDDR